MVWPARFIAMLSALCASACGRIGVDLIDVPAGPSDGAVAEPVDGALSDAGGMSDVDAAVARDSGREAVSDGGREDAAAGDAARLDASAVLSDAAVSDAALSDAQVAPTVCNVTGTYAVKITSPLTWPTAVVNGGSGSSSIWARVILTQAGQTLSGTLVPCGFVLPDFSLNPALGGALFQLSFPDPLFDHVPAYIPTSAVSITSSSGFGVGQPLSLASVAVLVGASLTNPQTDAWPSAAALTAPDMDADGSPGVTGLYSNVGGHVYPPADATARVDRAYTGARFVFSASGNLTSCSELSMTGPFAKFDTHIVGCRVSNGADCTTTQRDTVDGERPAFAPSTSSLRAIKVAAGVTCAQVRSMVP